MSKRILTLLGALALVGCQNFPGMHYPRVQQGAEISSKAVKQLKKGMTEKQVKNLMGQPLLDNATDANRWTYVWTLSENNQPMIVKKVVVIFKDGKVARILD